MCSIEFGSVLILLLINWYPWEEEFPSLVLEFGVCASIGKLEEIDFGSVLIFAHLQTTLFKRLIGIHGGKRRLRKQEKGTSQSSYQV